jgi:hypothetical protein
VSANLAAVFAADEPERLARLREARMAALLLLGPHHALTVALAAAIADPEVLGAAIEAIDGLPALQRRRLLATLAAVLPA